jgi:hypothetical protein
MAIDDYQQLRTRYLDKSVAAVTQTRAEET